MVFPEDVRRFLAPASERIVALAGLLAGRGVAYSVARTGASRHVVVRLGPGNARLALVAHYDRVGGSPGVLDNSCACIQLVEFASRLAAREGGIKAPPLLILFTDAEESPGSGGASDQGSFALARALRSAVGAGNSPPPALVLDVTGRGDRLVMSSAPARLLVRNGLGGSPLATGHTALLALARRAADSAGLGVPASLELPWSDDLGLVLGGIPALALSILPQAELDVYAEGLAALEADGAGLHGAGSRRAGPPERTLLGDAWPTTWGFLHGPDDGPALAEPASFALMAAFLDAVAALS